MAMQSLLTCIQRCSPTSMMCMIWRYGKLGDMFQPLQHMWQLCCEVDLCVGDSCSKGSSSCWLPAIRNSIQYSLLRPGISSNCNHHRWGTYSSRHAISQYTAVVQRGL
jgi:hypothetical protein